MIPISRDTTYAPLGMTHNNQILCGIKLDKRNIFTESTMSLGPVQNFCNTNADA